MNRPAIISGMTNRIAPYNTPEIMQTVSEWWVRTFPGNSTDKTVFELFDSYRHFVGNDVYGPEMMNINQFAKCLVRAKIADVDGLFMHLEEWTPKEYEVIRAKVY